MYKKYKVILSEKQFRYFYYLIFLYFIAMILETIGVGLIIPFVQVLLAEEPNKYLIKFLGILGIFPESKKSLIFIMISILAIVYTFKTFFLTYVSYVKTKIFADIRIALSSKLYDIYLNKPYSFHLNNNSSKLIRNINELDYTVYVLESLIMLISEAIIFLGNPGSFNRLISKSSR